MVMALLFNTFVFFVWANTYQRGYIDDMSNSIKQQLQIH